MTTRASTASVRPPRRTQQERRDATQQKLLEATLECLRTMGYARTTTTEIVRAAGVSQGALFKHYPSKAALLSAAIEYLFDELVADYQRAFAELPVESATAEAAFDLLWSIFTGPRLAVAFELYTVARTDPELGRALQPVVLRHRAHLVESARELFPEAARTIPDFAAWVDLMMCAMEGIVIERYGAGDVTGPALAVLKRLVLNVLTQRSPADGGPGGAPWTP